MCMKSILAPIDGAKSSHAVLNAAFLIAQEFSSHINVLNVKPDPRSAIPLLGEGMSGAMIEDMINMVEVEGTEQRAKAHSFYKSALEKYAAIEASQPVGDDKVTVQWLEDQGRDDEIIARYGRLADIILVPKPVEENEVYSTLALNAALFETGRPMMLLPEMPLEHFPKTVSICWNGSMEGARAVSAAKPFLKHADAVHIITADTSATDKPVGGELLDYLQWYDIKAEAIFFTPAGKSVGQALLSESQKLGAELMVMGGYTHSRMRELILGGATRDVIENAQIPVIMGH
ncbi:putative universal stress protein UspA-like [Candidatus Terasakiella magnetica]|uniref:Putative universal stress protein UspA-like n=1 Tax=Candidatus Terasakiella magnetica TaxID=1867952 RepID=A0A1C3RI50_9PROT|nr:universal stress protein [Candidatus Terasakiella magnetica]SCA56935.1 putative universal stress protein UspA-like [Candidatus Terasakiella magnetica]